MPATIGSMSSSKANSEIGLDASPSRAETGTWRDPTGRCRTRYSRELMRSFSMQFSRRFHDTGADHRTGAARASDSQPVGGQRHDQRHVQLPDYGERQSNQL